MKLPFLGAESFTDWLEGLLQGWVGAILSFIPKMLYQIMTALWAVLDAMQWIMRKLAGLDTIHSFAGSQDFSGDLVTYFINAVLMGESPVLSNVFWSMIILGAVMLVITTFIAVLRSEYTATDAKSASKGKIIVSAFKSLAAFAVVPIVCFFGMFLCNVILKAVDKITANPTMGTYESDFKSVQTDVGQTTYNHYSFFGYKVPTTATPISGIIFRTSAYNANRARNNTDFYTVMLNNPGVNMNGVFSHKQGNDPSDIEFNTAVIDEAFANCYRLKNESKVDVEPFLDAHMFPVNLGLPTYQAAELIIINSGFEYFDKNNTPLVWYYYDLFSFDFIIAIGAFTVIFLSMFNIVLGLIKRTFELTMLFLISAPIAALGPLDGGGALKKWRDAFISKAIGIYGPIVGMNLFFIILGVLSTLKLTGIPIIDAFVNLLFVIGGLTMVKDLSAFLSGLVGGEDTMKAGADKSKEMGDMAKQTIGKVAAVGGLIATGGAASVGLMTKLGGAAAKKFAGTKLGTKLANAKANRYKKGSKAYNKAVKNMAGSMNEKSWKEGVANFTDDEKKEYLQRVDERSKESFANMSDADRQKFLDKYGIKSAHKIDQTGADGKTRTTFVNKSNDELWSEIQGNEAAKNELKTNVGFGVASEMIATKNLDNMSPEERKYAIDDVYRNKGQRNRILHRAQHAAGGLEAFNALSPQEQARLKEESRHGNFNNKFTRAMGHMTDAMQNNAIASLLMKGSSSGDGTSVKLNAKKVELGEAGKAISEALGQYFKVGKNFVSAMSSGMFGGFGEGMKGTWDLAKNNFQGRTSKDVAKENAIKDETKRLEAQQAAHDTLYGKQPKEEKKPDELKLSDDSIKAMTKAISQANEASLDKQSRTLEQVASKIETAIDKLKNTDKP